MSNRCLLYLATPIKGKYYSFGFNLQINTHTRRLCVTKSTILSTLACFSPIWPVVVGFLFFFYFCMRCVETVFSVPRIFGISFSFSLSLLLSVYLCLIVYCVCAREGFDYIQIDFATLCRLLLSYTRKDILFFFGFVLGIFFVGLRERWRWCCC